MGVSARLSMTGGLNSARPVSIFAKQDRLLNIYPDAEVAYSLDKLDKNYEGSAVRVRRSSDNQEQDIGFVNDLFDSASLEFFVNINEDVYISDFPNGAENPSSGNASIVTSQTLQAPSTIDGFNDAMKFTCSSLTSTNYDFRIATMDRGQLISVSFQYYIPSENTIVESIRFTDLLNLSQAYFITKGEWTTVTITDKEIDNNILRFFAANSGGATNLGLEVTESFYIRNLEVTQSTASAYVTTWYDQSGNAVNATQSTASKQPKIAVQGAYLGYVENITSTSTATLNSSYEYVAGQRFTSFIVGQQFGSAVFGGTNSGNVYYAVSQDGNTQNSRLGFENLSMFGNGNSVADRREDVASLMVNTALLTTLAQRNIGEQSQTLAMGYTTGSFNNCRFKEYIIYNNQSVNREEVEAYIMEHYNL